MAPFARYTARWVLPVVTPPIRDGAVLVDTDGRIAVVGPAHAVPRLEAAHEIDLGDAALLPGFVNAHAHLELSFLRGHVEDRRFPDWIAALLDAKRRAALLPSHALASARWSCVEAIAAGITTVAATEDSDAAFDALLESGQRGIVYREVFGPAPEQAAGSMATLRNAIAAMRSRETDRVRVGVSPHAPYTVSDALYEHVAALARGEALPVAAHIAESQDEQSLVTLGSGPFAERLAARGIATPVRARSPIALLHRTGILDLQPLLVHCVLADTADIVMLAESGASVAHCPVANGRLGHGIAPVSELLDAGVPVSLGTDSVASNNRVDLLEEARCAQILQRASRGDATLLPAERLLRLVTIDGARALGLDGRIGSIEPGKDADLCAVSLGGPHVQPVHDPITALFHSARASDVCLAVVRGAVLFRDGVWHTLDVERARSDVEAVAARVRNGSVPAPPHGNGPRGG